MGWMALAAGGCTYKKRLTLRNGLKRVDSRSADTQKEVVPKKKTCFVIEKYVRDVKQVQKITPDLAESIIRPADPVKEEPGRILLKLTQFRPKTTILGLQFFGRPGNHGFLREANTASKPTKF